MKKIVVLRILVAVIFLVDVIVILFPTQISSLLFIDRFQVTLSINPNGFKSKEQIFISQMTLEEKVGQMFLVGFWGATPNSDIEDLIKNKNIGGVILFHYNIESREQLTLLIQELQSQSISSSAEIPLFISVDQEGGIVSRLNFDGFDELTSQPEIESDQQAYSVGRNRGAELTTLGVNMNFSPVLDYSNNKDSFLYNRTFRGSMAEVSSLATNMINGYSESNIISVVKHFPGHPDSIVDSHSELPIVDCSVSEFPYFAKQFIDILSNPNTRVLMSGHISFPQIDSENPASLSPIILTELLKTQYGYEGLVVTDDLEMGAIVNRFTPAESAVKAVLAGNDILMFSSTYDSQLQAYDAVLSAVKDGTIDEESINESVMKIIKLKKAFWELSN